ncbi:uncharacterized protein LOC107615184 isoform X1 [Arachis ipaensis]|uniref:Uncharacterized protein n=1 Tax=Arachis hypogaea TaxID=3818 RepID=A0A444XH51_ARAHY|nr:uncharacterized protein LOC107615184 isoform X1 [Arachis ipaensis]RYQ89066.1 hypothetical protein Ahy_B09g095908 isoform B [Arachis hypogaea]
MSFFLSPSTSFFHRCRYSSRCMISLCHPLRCTSSLLVVLLLRFLSHAGISKLMVIDVLVSLFCCSIISAETLWDGGWLLCQLLPYSESEFNSNHLKMVFFS